jgi:hypothetical protein
VALQQLLLARAEFPRLVEWAEAPVGFQAQVQNIQEALGRLQPLLAGQEVAHPQWEV